MQQRTKKHYAELIVETIHFYEKNPRGLTDNGKDCVYFNEHTGHKCAVGRCMTPAALRLFKNNSDTPVDHLMSQFPDKKLFLPEYNGIAMGFWQGLQYLHDDVDNWSMTKATKHNMHVYELTLAGIKEIRSIIASYGLGPYIKFTNDFTEISIKLKDQ